MSLSRCSGCSRAIQWAKTPSGKNVPLEPIETVKVGEDGVARPIGVALVNHFLTCPKANNFSSRNKK